MYNFHFSSIADRTLSVSVLEGNQELTFEIVESGTKRGGKKLISSHGFSYTVKVE